MTLDSWIVPKRGKKRLIILFVGGTVDKIRAEESVFTVLIEVVGTMVTTAVMSVSVNVLTFWALCLHWCTLKTPEARKSTANSVNCWECVRLGSGAVVPCLTRPSPRLIHRQSKEQ